MVGIVLRSGWIRIAVAASSLSSSLCGRCLIGFSPGLSLDSCAHTQPTGTSSKFAAMMCQALDAFQERHGVRFDKVTSCPLEGEGTIEKRVERYVDRVDSCLAPILGLPGGSRCSQFASFICLLPDPERYSHRASCFYHF
jgi:hypothetical protein